MRDLKRFISGPAYARRLTAMAQEAGATLETEAMVTGWAGERALQVTSPRGIRTVTADAVVLATGARERPRPARLVPGDRPDGVYTTGQLQNLVHLHHAHVGSTRVDRRRRTGQLVGGVDPARSRLRHSRNGQRLPAVGGLRGVPAAGPVAAGRAGVDPQPGRRHQRQGPGARRRWWRTLETGARTTVECDTVVFTGDWIPDHELARTGGLAMDPATRGPVVDAGLRDQPPRACSRSATCCTRSTPPTAPRWTDAMSPPR